MTSFIKAAMLGAALVWSANAFALTGDAAKGAVVFKKCAICHKVGPNAKPGVGPVQNNLIGATAGCPAWLQLLHRDERGWRQGHRLDSRKPRQVPYEPESHGSWEQDGFPRPAGCSGPRGRHRLSCDPNRPISRLRPFLVIFRTLPSGGVLLLAPASHAAIDCAAVPKCHSSALTKAFLPHYLPSH